MAMIKLDFVTVDVFTASRFTGNPLAIVKIPGDITITQDQKQKIAQEFNLSETVFLHEDAGSPEEWKVDIFTTTAELPFAGK
jgi:PhzF family phenazine biosynthesis protein